MVTHTAHDSIKVQHLSCTCGTSTAHIATAAAAGRRAHCDPPPGPNLVFEVTVGIDNLVAVTLYSSMTDSLCTDAAIADSVVAAPGCALSCLCRAAQLAAAAAFSLCAAGGAVQGSTGL